MPDLSDLLRASEEEARRSSPIADRTTEMQRERSRLRLVDLAQQIRYLTDMIRLYESTQIEIIPHDSGPQGKYTARLGDFEIIIKITPPSSMFNFLSYQPERTEYVLKYKGGVLHSLPTNNIHSEFGRSQAEMFIQDVRVWLPFSIDRIDARKLAELQALRERLKHLNGQRSSYRYFESLFDEATNRVSSDPLLEKLRAKYPEPGGGPRCW